MIDDVNLYLKPFSFEDTENYDGCHKWHPASPREVPTSSFQAVFGVKP